MSGTDTTTAEFSASHTEKITTGSDSGFCIGGYSASTIGLAVVALIIALLWTAAVIGFVGALCKKKRKSSSGSSDSCDSGTGWAGALIGFVVWIVVLALLIAVVCMWQWIGLLIFVVIFILFALAGWWMGCKNAKESRD